ncbi:centrosomal protein 20-like [Stegodyphus dumicola]|uniref:centrosomal protein 20-like n=1 Tax=Stegodyphus dumicola TaxID=202533 RepID=UPI0015B0478C|nr:centrosomal protein 20-like [Stegodyphus dumicola]
MATARDLKDALKEALSKSGALSEIRARLRAEVFSVLQDENEPPPPLSNENLMINELIREYLIYNGYLFTESVLVAESGQPQFQLESEFLKDWLRVKSTKGAEELPLLYGLIASIKEGTKPSASSDVPVSSTQT